MLINNQTNTGSNVVSTQYGDIKLSLKNPKISNNNLGSLKKSQSPLPFSSLDKNSLKLKVEKSPAVKKLDKK